MSFKSFPRQSPFLIMVLIFCTLGFYLPWWLYTRTQTLNRLYPQKPVPQIIVAICMSGLIMLIFLIFQMPAVESVAELSTIPEFQRIMDAAMVVNLLQFFWAMIFCHRLNLCTQTKMGDTLYASYFVLLLSHLFIVSIFYLQFKLNQLIDADTKPQAPIGIM